VLNGSDGVNEMVTGVVAQGLTIYDTLRKTVGGATTESAAGATSADGAPSHQPPADGGTKANGTTPDRQITETT
jgi:hypothetical protein